MREVKEERRKKMVLVLDLDLRVPPVLPPMASTYSGVSVQGAGQLCSILLGNVCVREFVGRGLKSEEERKEKSKKANG